MDVDKFKKHLSKRIKHKTKLTKHLAYILEKTGQEHYYDVQHMEAMLVDLRAYKQDFIQEHSTVTDYMNAEDPDTIELHKDGDLLEARVTEVLEFGRHWLLKMAAVIASTSIDENTHPDLVRAVEAATLPGGNVAEQAQATNMIGLAAASGAAGRLIPDGPPVRLKDSGPLPKDSLDQGDNQEEDQPVTHQDLRELRDMIAQATTTTATNKTVALHYDQLKQQLDSERIAFVQQITALTRQLDEVRFDKTRRAMSTPARLSDPRAVQFDDTVMSNVGGHDYDREYVKSLPDKSLLLSRGAEMKQLLNDGDQLHEHVHFQKFSDMSSTPGPAIVPNAMSAPPNYSMPGCFQSMSSRDQGRTDYLRNLSSGRLPGRASGSTVSGAPIGGSDPSALVSLMSHNNTMIQSFIEDSRASFITQQETNDMPKSKLPVFSGDPLQYWTFMKAYDDLVGSTSMRYAKKLNVLLMHCSPEVKKLIQGCQLMIAEEGYNKARAVLRQKFGNPFLISQAWKSKIAGYQRVNTPELLESYAEDLVCCYNTLMEMGHISEMENSDCLSTVSSKLDNGLRAKWRKIHRQALRRNESGGFRDLVDLILTSADEQNDPVYNNQRLDSLSGGFTSAPIRPRRDQDHTPATKHFKEKKHRATYTTFLSSNNDASDDSEDEFNRQIVTMATEVSSRSCIVCSGPHYISACPEFEKMDPKQRLETARVKRLCLLCLNPGHFIDKCTFSWKCQVQGCVFRHNTLLHGAFDLRATPSRDQARQRQRKEVSTNLIDLEDPDQDESTIAEVDVCLSNIDAKIQVDLYKTITIRHAALPITPVIVYSDTDHVLTYALLDSGSTATICTTRLLSILKPMKRGSAELTINTIHGKQTTTGGIYNLTIKGIHQEEILPMFDVVSLENMPISTSHIAAAGDIDFWPHLKSLPMANVDAKYVDLLIGQDNAHLLKPVRTVEGPKLRDPFAVVTPLGWTIYGLRQTPSAIQSKNVSLNLMIVQDETTLTPSLEDTVNRLWSLDRVPEIQRVSAVDRMVTQQWDNELLVIDGYIQLPIPLKKKVPDFPNNRPAVLARLQSLGKRLQKDPELHRQYTSAMKLNFDQGYAIQVFHTPAPGNCWYLTQLPVQHKRKLGVVRPVWNGGFKYRGRCLNDEVYQGPEQTNRIVTVMVNFRLLPVAVMGDIKQMYNQVKVPKEQQDLMRFLYWKDGDPNNEVIDCCLTYHMFGGSWSPSACCYAVRKIIELAKLDPNGETAKTIMKAFYVDNCVKSIKDVETGITLFKEITTVLGRYHFDFTKLVSNKPELIDAFPENKRAADSVDLDFDGGRVTIQHSLGQRWQPGDDIFCFICCFLMDPKTRRELLSTLSTLYDPLGLCAPFLIPAKRLLQELTKRGLKWDDKLPEDVLTQWKRWVKDSACINELRIPRWVGMTCLEQEIWLIYYSDASEVAYGSACYLCTVEDETIKSSNLLMSRSRLSPMKSQSIPRLELCAALVSAQLHESVLELLDVKPTQVRFWTDSVLVLRYLHSEPSSYKTFIGNRISAIQQITDKKDWYHVPTELNPADCLSRGVSARGLIDSKLWLHGPAYLTGPKSEWPSQPEFLTMPPPEDERKKVKEIYGVHAMTICKKEPQAVQNKEHALLSELWMKISTWDTLVRRVAWIMMAIARFKLLLSPTGMKGVAMVNADDMYQAKVKIIGAAQDMYLSQEEKNKKSFLKMFPRLRDGLLCIGGRLERASLPTEFKQPFVLSPNNPLTTLYIRHCHDVVYHSGITRTLMETRKFAWILNGRNDIKRVVDSCVICKKYKSPPMTQVMADLPSHRLTPGVRPFATIGLDYLGPLQIKQGRSLAKRYICVIVCSVTRAIHLEPAVDLSTSCFLNAFTRFISRRGKPENVLSDNGTNFVGAKAELVRESNFWNKEGVNRYCSDKGISWRFNPPAASHFGGMWERHNRTIRSLLLCMADGHTLTEESFQTLLCLIEYSLNSRPLTKLNDDPGDPSPLTPNLILLRETTDPIRGMFFSTDALRSSWKQSQYLADSFWQRWLHEYLGELQRRTKWLERKENLTKGSLVLLMNDNAPRHSWPLGLVEMVHVGSDGMVRAADVRTSNGMFTRPIVKIVLLEADLIAS